MFQFTNSACWVGKTCPSRSGNSEADNRSDTFVHKLRRKAQQLQSNLPWTTWEGFLFFNRCSSAFYRKLDSAYQNWCYFQICSTWMRLDNWLQCVHWNASPKLLGKNLISEIALFSQLGIWTSRESGVLFPSWKRRNVQSATDDHFKILFK